MLHYRLEKMQPMSDAAVSSHQAIQDLKVNAAKDIEGDPQRLLVIIDDQPATRKLKKSNPVKLAILEARIEMLEAKISITEKLLNKLNGQL